MLKKWILKYVAVPRPRKVSWHLDDNADNQHFLTSNEEVFRVNFFYEVLDIMISEFGRRFNKRI